MSGVGSEDILIRLFRLLDIAFLMEANRVVKRYLVRHCFPTASARSGSGTLAPVP